MSTEYDFLDANREYAARFEHGDLPAPPRRHLAVLTCMDARVLPHRFLGLEIGDAHIIRNAGGRATDDAIRSLILSWNKLGTREIAVIHHTDCGLHAASNETLRASLQHETGADASAIDFLPFADLEESVREDVRTLRASPYIPPYVWVRGYIYDVKTGKLTPVQGA